MTHRLARRLLIAGAVCLMGSGGLATRPVEAQEPGRIGSRLLSLDSWAYEAVERLTHRGLLPGLDPLAQPYRRIDVAAAVLAGADLPASPVEARWLDQLKEELAAELARLRGDPEAGRERGGIHLKAGYSGSDTRRRDPLMPYREGEQGVKDRNWPAYWGGIWLEAHNLAAETRLHRDWWHRGRRGDPDGDPPGGFEIFGRSDNAYVTAAFPWGDLWVGRFARNWGPSGQLGLMVSSNPTTYPQIGFDLGRGRLSFHFMAGELEPKSERKRYLVANRVSYGTDRFHVSVGEAALYSGQGNTLRLINPAEAIFFDHNAENDRSDLTGNVMLNAMVWARVGQGTVFGEFALDDFDLNPRTGVEDRGIEATSYQVSLGARYYGLSDQVELGLDYRRVSAWSYRTDPTYELWEQLNRGLADPWSDYDRLSLRADLYPDVPGLRVGPLLQYQRKGEGDYRTPFPPRDVMVTLPGIFHGTMETTVRVALQGRYQPRREVFVEWDLGRSFVGNAGHVDGADEQRFSYLVRLVVTWDLEWGRL